MKIFKLVLTGAILVSGYIGYQNFGVDNIDMLKSVVSSEEKVAERKPKVSRSAPQAIKDMEERMAPKEEPKEEEPIDYIDIIIKLGETIAPLGAPYLASRKRKTKTGEVKTLDDDIGDIAVHLGVSKAFVRGRLGLGDRRKKQVGTKKRRASD